MLLNLAVSFLSLYNIEPGMFAYENNAIRQYVEAWAESKLS